MWTVRFLNALPIKDRMERTSMAEGFDTGVQPSSDACPECGSSEITKLGNEWECVCGHAWSEDSGNCPGGICTL